MLIMSAQGITAGPGRAPPVLSLCRWHKPPDMAKYAACPPRMLADPPNPRPALSRRRGGRPRSRCRPAALSIKKRRSSALRHFEKAQLPRASAPAPPHPRCSRRPGASGCHASPAHYARLRCASDKPAPLRGGWASVLAPLHPRCSRRLGASGEEPFYAVYHIRR